MNRASPLPIVLDERSCSRNFNEFQCVTLKQVESVIMKSPTKSCPLDPIPTIMLKECLDVLIAPITNIINLSLSTGVVPEVLKIARVLPLIKKQSLDPDVLANYRPISNLPFLSKVLERIVALQLHEHLSTCDLYPKLQSAYRRFHSTETALLRVHNDLLMTVDSGNEALLFLLDFSAAFDTIDHDILFHRLEYRFGLSGSVIEWVKSFFHSRSLPTSLLKTNRPRLLLYFMVSLKDLFWDHYCLPVCVSFGRYLRCPQSGRYDIC